MSQFVDVPLARIAPQTRQALLEEFASRDGTDYGERETSLERRVEQLIAKLQAGELVLLFELESESWDIVPKENAELLLQNG